MTCGYSFIFWSTYKELIFKTSHNHVYMLLICSSSQSKVANLPHKVHCTWKMLILMNFGIPYKISTNSDFIIVRTAFWPRHKICSYCTKKNKGIKPCIWFQYLEYTNILLNSHCRYRFAALIAVLWFVTFILYIIDIFLFKYFTLHCIYLLLYGCLLVWNSATYHLHVFAKRGLAAEPYRWCTNEKGVHLYVSPTWRLDKMKQWCTLRASSHIPVSSHAGQDLGDWVASPKEGILWKKLWNKEYSIHNIICLPNLL